LEIVQAASPHPLKSLLRLGQELHRKKAAHLQQVAAAGESSVAGMQPSMLVDGALEVSN
jgi:hypothetical protein